jgi:hypothetical protein
MGRHEGTDEFLGLQAAMRAAFSDRDYPGCDPK